jgi:hypothetical protein
MGQHQVEHLIVVGYLIDSGATFTAEMSLLAADFPFDAALSDFLTTQVARLGTGYHSIKPPSRA